jgi:hypothetical protein
METRKEGKREEILNWNSMHYIKILTKGIAGLNRKIKQVNLILNKHEQH